MNYLVEFIGGPACGRTLLVSGCAREVYTYESEHFYFTEFGVDGKFRAFHEQGVTADVEAAS